eukprot:CAMPEP_0174266844 /NCGR_PEP_ID=MMETSP0439-20130205/31636_1 /TAXON_ID=0 /ORGANISM="Stereomyxa ramosa, Strain Chinc5" /LENGTH=248 /DNA_ID=CAMNT_0015354051 /DNA_START=90 /DNA_END=833 /DNA_ORIENTATION=-
MKREPATTRTYEEALDVLYTKLISNEAAMKDWQDTRRTQRDITLYDEMVQYLKRVHVQMNSLSYIHIAGTKGKGSTGAFTESILRRGFDLTTGFYTSPNLVHPRERIRINGKPISEEKFAHYFWLCHDLLLQSSSADEALPSFFRFLTVMAFKIFFEEKVSVAIMEVGVGGRTDATNVIEKPCVTAITPLGYDHCAVLGDTIEEIAYEKAGIYKKGCVALTVPQDEGAMEVIINKANDVEAKFSIAPP